MPGGRPRPNCQRRKRPRWDRPLSPDRCLSRVMRFSRVRHPSHFLPLPRDRDLSQLTVLSRVMPLSPARPLNGQGPSSLVRPSRLACRRDYPMASPQAGRPLAIPPLPAFGRARPWHRPPAQPGPLRRQRRLRPRRHPRPQPLAVNPSPKPNSTNSSSSGPGLPLQAPRRRPRRRLRPPHPRFPRRLRLPPRPPAPSPRADRPWDPGAWPLQPPPRASGRPLGPSRAGAWPVPGARPVLTRAPPGVCTVHPGASPGAPPPAVAAHGWRWSSRSVSPSSRRTSCSTCGSSVTRTWPPRRRS